MPDMHMRRQSSRLKALSLAALLIAPIGALAASPGDDYVAARDRDMAELKALEAPEDWPKHKVLQDKDTKELEQRLRAIIGPVAIPGFPYAGRLNAYLYAGDPSFGEIDGLAYYDGEKYDDVDAVIVTTDGLLDKWLLGHPRRWSKVDVPHAATAAVKIEAFYTQGMTRQGYVVRYATVPIVAPRGAKFAEAMLATIDASPDLPEAPERLFIALEKGGRVFLVSVGPTIPMKGIAACNALSAAYEGKASAAEKTFTKFIDRKSEARIDNLRNQGRAAFLSCFRDKSGTTPEFAAVSKQAAALIEALAKN
jgi:hypothetical protein